MANILVLGNEFISQDSLAKKVGNLLKKDHEIIDVKDSFQLMTLLQEIEHPILLDVVKDLNEVKIIPAENIKAPGILTAHDFDAAQVIKLIGKPVTIIGIPMQGDVEEITLEVRRLLPNPPSKSEWNN